MIGQPHRARAHVTRATRVGTDAREAGERMQLTDETLTVSQRVGPCGVHPGVVHAIPEPRAPLTTRLAGERIVGEGSRELIVTMRAIIDARRATRSVSRRARGSR